MPIHMRLPKLKGFKNPFRVEYQVVNVAKLAELFPDGGTVGVDELVAARRGPQGRAGEGARQRRPRAVKLDITANASPARPARRSSPPAARSPTVSSIAPGVRYRLVARYARAYSSASLEWLARLTAGMCPTAPAPASQQSAPGGAVLSAFGIGRSGRRTCARSCCSRWRSSRCTGSGSTIPTPDATTSNVHSCLARRPEQLEPLLADQPVLRRRAAAAVGRSRSGIMPYITASIIIQLLVVVIPRFEQLKKEGQSGQPKLTQYSRYLTIGAGDPAVHRLHRAGRARPAVPGLRRHQRSILYTDLGLPHRDHGHHHDGRHRASSCGWASSSPTAASATACRC